MLTALFLVLVVQANSAQPINIEALQFEMLLAERKAVYTGDVEVTQGDYTINADELVVFFDEDNKIAVMQATGTPATLADQIRQPPLLITGDELDYLFVESIVRANGNGILKQGEDFVRAETIVYDLDAQTARATGAGNERDSMARCGVLSAIRGRHRTDGRRASTGRRPSEARSDSPLGAADCDVLGCYTG